MHVSLAPRAGLAPGIPGVVCPRPARSLGTVRALRSQAASWSHNEPLSFLRPIVLVSRIGPCHVVRPCWSAARARGQSVRTRSMMFERFTEKAVKVIMLAQEESKRMGHAYVGTEQMLLGLLQETTGIASQVLRSQGVSLKEARVEAEKLSGRGQGVSSKEMPFSPRCKVLLDCALEEARALGHTFVGTEHILLAILRDDSGVARSVLDALGADSARMRAAVLRMVADAGREPAAAGAGGGASAAAGGAGAGGGAGRMPVLEEFGSNLTRAAEEGRLDPCVGRHSEIERVTQILGRRTKNNPCLIGEPGVGKTAVAEGLAQRIVAGDVPDTLEGKQVVTLDMGLLVAGTKYRGEFEDRVKRLMEELRANRDVILMIDEVHTLIGAGAAEGAIDAANILKPALARGDLQCIGATTLDEYRKHIEKDPALERRFQPVHVPEPSVDETVDILRGLRERYEAHHKLRYSDDSLSAAARFSHQYIADRFLPDKAIDLVDEAGSRVRLRHSALPDAARAKDRALKALAREKDAAVRAQDFEAAGRLRDREMELRAEVAALAAAAREARGAGASGSASGLASAAGGEGPVVDAEDIAEVVAQWTGIPVAKVSSDESSRLVNMEGVLHGRVIGQEEAVGAIARALRRARVGLKAPNRPIASFMFSGPTGVGKSELAKSLAGFYYGSEEAMVRLDMSEYMERHTVSKLIGSPPGYVGYSEGGQLTEAVRRRPYAVLLFDEIEKAHPDVFNMMLQILEDGRLTDSKGRVVDFKNTLIIMTSNVGSAVVEKGGQGFGFLLPSDVDDASYARIKAAVNEELKQHFRPEFLNRLDEIIVFRQLTKSEVKSIAALMLREVFRRADARGIALDVTERFKDRLVEEGYSPNYGARPLRRAIMRLLEDSLADRILAGDIREGDSVILDVDADGQITVLNGDRKMLGVTCSVPAGIA